MLVHNKKSFGRLALTTGVGLPAYVDEKRKGVTVQDSLKHLLFEA